MLVRDRALLGAKLVAYAAPAVRCLSVADRATEIRHLVEPRLHAQFAGDLQLPLSSAADHVASEAASGRVVVLLVVVVDLDAGLFQLVLKPRLLANVAGEPGDVLH